MKVNKEVLFFIFICVMPTLLTTGYMPLLIGLRGYSNTADNVFLRYISFRLIHYSCFSLHQSKAMRITKCLIDEKSLNQENRS